MTRTYPRTARNDLRAEITSDSGGEGVWDWATARAFQVLDLMDLAGIPIPEGIDYTPAAGLDWELFEQDPAADLLRYAWENVSEHHGAHAADEALAYWARVLIRYLGLPAVAATGY